MIIKPDKNVLKSWIHQYVPDKDLFFITETLFNSDLNLTDVLVMPKEEFYNHNTYNQLHYMNSYEYWNIKNIQYVIIAEKGWIETLPNKLQEWIFKIQVQVNRGLVVPANFLSNIHVIPSPYIQDENIVIQRLMWERLDYSIKEELLIKLATEWWDNGECIDIPQTLPVFLKPYTNTFSHQQGSNCLAAVLYAITEGKQNWFIHEWIHQNTFIGKLKQLNYIENDGRSIKPNDIVLWKDEHNIIQHAAYHIKDNLYFNKQGQTMFSPWKIISKEQLYQEWKHLNPVIYTNYQ